MAPSRKLGIILGILFLVVGCGSTSMEPHPTFVSDDPEQIAYPTSIEIPKLKARSSLIETGILKDNQLETPPVTKPEQASWYNLSPKPGAKGPAVILGHV